MSRFAPAEVRASPPPCPAPILEAFATGHVAGPNARSGLTFFGLLLIWATRNTR